MTQRSTFFNGANIIAGPALTYTSTRDVALPLVSAITVPAVTSTTFTLSTADAAKLNKGDLLSLATVANTFLCAEMATLAMITSIVASTLGYNVVVAPAMGTPPTTANGIRQVWANRGASLGGVDFMAKAETKLLECDQATMAVGKVDSKKTVGIKAPLVEATLANFALAAGIKDPATGTVLQYNSTDLSRSDRYAVVGKAPAGNNRWFIIHNGAAQGTATHKNSKDGQPIYQMEVTAIVDSAMTPDAFDCLDA